ncbi:hypothetical protein KA005_67850 [bacterium]|nr:hypothetical protein [bacterium]
MAKKHKTKIIFLDNDLACLFSDLEITHLTCVQSAIFLQVIDGLIRISGKKSILVTIPKLQEEYFPYFSLSAVKRLLQRLRKLGILKTRIEYKGLDHKTRIWIINERITTLAKEVQQANEDQNSWDRIRRQTQD